MAADGRTNTMRYPTLLLDVFYDPELGAIAVLYDDDGNVVATGADSPLVGGSTP